MSRNSIPVSEKHGLNPIMGVCRFCGRDDGTIALAGKYNRKDEKGHVVEYDAEAPRRAVVSTRPCRTCIGLTQDGVILLSASNDPTRPAATGEFQFLWPHDLKDRFMACEGFPEPAKAVETILERRIAFITDELWDSLGLPRKRSDAREFVEVAKYMPKAPKNSPISPQEEFAVEMLFGAEYFRMGSYLWWDGAHLLASQVEARKPWSGAFRNFVHRCQEFKIQLQVPTAVNEMPHILEKWGWTKSVVPHSDLPGEVTELWDPPKEGPWVSPKTA